MRKRRATSKHETMMLHYRSPMLTSGRTKAASRVTTRRRRSAPSTAAMTAHFGTRTPDAGATAILAASGGGDGDDEGSKDAEGAVGAAGAAGGPRVQRARRAARSGAGGVMSRCTAAAAPAAAEADTVPAASRALSRASSRGGRRREGDREMAGLVNQRDASISGAGTCAAMVFLSAT